MINRTSRTNYKIRAIPIAAGFLLLLFSLATPKTASAIEWKDPVEIGLAYTTHLFLHEVGHQVVADQVDAENSRMDFLTRRDGNFYMGLSTYQSIPEESKLPYAVGGEWMSGFTIGSQGVFKRKATHPLIHFPMQSVGSG